MGRRRRGWVKGGGRCWVERGRRRHWVERRRRTGRSDRSISGRAFAGLHGRLYAPGLLVRCTIARWSDGKEGKKVERTEPALVVRSPSIQSGMARAQRKGTPRGSQPASVTATVKYSYCKRVVKHNQVHSDEARSLPGVLLTSLKVRESIQADRSGHGRRRSSTPTRLEAPAPGLLALVLTGCPAFLRCRRVCTLERMYSLLDERDEPRRRKAAV